MDKKSERARHDSGQQEPALVTSNLKQRDRERRDSHRSNHSSNIGNSRDDLDRWRSLRSFSREQSTEGYVCSIYLTFLLIIFCYFFLIQI